MNKKNIFLTISGLLFFYLIFTLSSPKKDSNQNSEVVENNTKKQGTNEIKNIEYNNFDSVGNNFIISAESGIIDDNQTEIVNMKNVTSIIKTKDNRVIKIQADNAVYNFKNYDTNFKNNISIINENNIATCEELDFLFSEKILIMKSNIVFNNHNTVFFSDKIEFDIITKNIKVDMFSKDDFVNLIFKKNGSN